MQGLFPEYSRNETDSFDVFYRNVVFFAGSFWVVLVGLTVWDEDFLAVEHIVTALAILSMILAVCRAAIPDEVSRNYS